MSQTGAGREASGRVVVAMSGGVDSSVAAAMLVETGFDAIGVTMRLSEGGSRCCSLDDADDARRVAEKLGIRFYVANYAEAFQREVIQPFASAYLEGRTPIPCVACNKNFKFDHLWERARVFGADRVATGHYARLTHDADTGQARLFRGRDRQKDQSYFLFSLDQAQLRSASFPLGDLEKGEVRARARALGMATADKPESQEICFVPEGKYAEVVERLRPEASRLHGYIVDREGRVLGEHAGVHHFTVGQRHGLGISSDRRLYVLRLDPRRQEVLVGPVDALDRSEAMVEQVNWIAGEAPTTPLRVRVQVRHRHHGAVAELRAEAGGRASIRFEEPVRAVAPGQAAVFYDEERDEEVVGGGWLARGDR